MLGVVLSENILLLFGTSGERLSLHELLITLFLVITVPVSAHLLSKAALHLARRQAGTQAPAASVRA